MTTCFSPSQQRHDCSLKTTQWHHCDIIIIPKVTGSPVCPPVIAWSCDPATGYVYSADWMIYWACISPRAFGHVTSTRQRSQLVSYCLALPFLLINLNNLVNPSHSRGYEIASLSKGVSQWLALPRIKWHLTLVSTCLQLLMLKTTIFLQGITLFKLTILFTYSNSSEIDTLLLILSYVIDVHMFTKDYNLFIGSKKYP